MTEKPEAQRPKSAREIETSIGETRNALRDDISALGDKVSPENIKHEVKQAVKNAGEQALDKAVEAKDVVVDKAIEVKDAVVEKATEVKDAAIERAHEAADTISETYDEVSYQTRRAGRAAWSFTVDNAVPLSLIGIGASWLLVNRSSRNGRKPDRYWDEELADYPPDNLAYSRGYAYDEYPDSRARDYATRSGDSARRPAVRATRRQPSAREGMQRTAAKVREEGRSLSERVDSVMSTAGHAVADQASHGREIVEDRWRRVRDGSRDVAQQNPLALALGTLVAGVGIGLLLPGTKREDRLLEPTRDRMRRPVNRARDTAQDVGRIAKRTADDTLATVQGQRQP
jgi:ElaB/YqjD/DUF883 family membrane-anchored ribosome-binding protein